MSVIVCSRPECQTTAGCMCAKLQPGISDLTGEKKLERDIDFLRDRVTALEAEIAAMKQFLVL